MIESFDPAFNLFLPPFNTLDGLLWQEAARNEIRSLHVLKH